MAVRRRVHGLDPEGSPNGWHPQVQNNQMVLGPPVAGLHPSAGRPPRLVPFGVKLRGANIVPQGYGAGGTSGDPWGQMFAEFDASWEAVIKPQIDRAAASGANAVRCIGSIAWIFLNLDTPANYLAAYEQMVDYAANLGLWFYACLSDAGHWAGATKAEALAIMAPVAAMLETKPNVFAIDVAQELGLNSSIKGSDTLHDFLAYLIDGLRSSTTLPMTASSLHSSNSSSAQWSSATTATFADVVDFYDFHPYYDGLVATDLDPFFAANTAGLPLLLGEYGADATKLARYSAAAAVSALAGVVGSFAWAIVDYNADGSGGAWGPTGAWGLFDYTYTERTALTDIFKTVPDHEGTLPEAGHIIVNDTTVLPARGRLNIKGAGVTVTDDPGNDQTLVEIDGTGGGGSSTRWELVVDGATSSPPVLVENADGTDYVYAEVPA